MRSQLLGNGATPGVNAGGARGGAGLPDMSFGEEDASDRKEFEDFLQNLQSDDLDLSAEMGGLGALDLASLDDPSHAYALGDFGNGWASLDPYSPQVNNQSTQGSFGGLYDQPLAPATMPATPAGRGVSLLPPRHPREQPPTPSRKRTHVEASPALYHSRALSCPDLDVHGADPAALQHVQPAQWQHAAAQQSASFAAGPAQQHVHMRVSENVGAAYPHAAANDAQAAPGAPTAPVVDEHGNVQASWAQWMDPGNSGWLQGVSAVWNGIRGGLGLSSAGEMPAAQGAVPAPEQQQPPPKRRNSRSGAGRSDSAGSQGGPAHSHSNSFPSLYAGVQNMHLADSGTTTLPSPGSGAVLANTPPGKQPASGFSAGAEPAMPIGATEPPPSGRRRRSGSRGGGRLSNASDCDVTATGRSASLTSTEIARAAAVPQNGVVSADLQQLYPSLARKSKGGRKCAPDPRLDPNIDPKRAQRILSNRIAAARSKARKKEEKERQARQEAAAKQEAEAAELRSELARINAAREAAEAEDASLRAQLWQQHQGRGLDKRSWDAMLQRVDSDARYLLEAQSELDGQGSLEGAASVPSGLLASQTAALRAGSAGAGCMKGAVPGMPKLQRTAPVPPPSTAAPPQPLQLAAMPVSAMPVSTGAPAQDVAGYPGGTGAAAGLMMAPPGAMRPPLADPAPAQHDLSALPISHQPGRAVR
ncbi:unnamed protein product [Pedinophyceae sp. YPF-701]|nr:unnamed protein product [Pedinophyceae sp. YPF-701]